MKRNKHKWTRPQKRGAAQPKRVASVNVRSNTNKRPSRISVAIRKLIRRVKEASIGFWAFFIVVAGLLSFWLDAHEAISDWFRSKPPAAEIMYFKKENANYSLVDPTNVVLWPTRTELDKNYLAVPINLAVRNQDKDRLEATRVEITYPKGLRVVPAGRPKIDPQNNTLIYEHELRSLDPVASFTPLDTIDVIYFEHSVRGVRTTMILHDNLVAAGVAVGVEITEFPNGVNLQVKVFSSGRPPVESELHFSVDTSQALGDSENTFDPVPLKKKDAALFQAVSRRLRIADRKWEVRVAGKAMTLAFAKTPYGRGFYNGLLLDGNVTEVFADHDGDGILDYHLADSTNPNSPDQKSVPLHPEPLTDMRRPDEVQWS
jgi:hypothetical protein